MIRFSKNGYNVPFGRKPNRFRPALITKIVNQVAKTQEKIIANNWTFICSNWKDTIINATTNDFIYLDPPYIGRNTDYFTSWNLDNANKLADYFNDHTELHFALSCLLYTSPSPRDS